MMAATQVISGDSKTRTKITSPTKTTTKPTDSDTLGVWPDFLLLYRSEMAGTRFVTADAP
jgi:hypothetical protein